jgi:hypothetical protein
MRTVVGIFVVFYFLTGFCPQASANQNESADPGYNFAKVRTVLIMEPNFTYNGFDVSGNNRFVTYPHAAEKAAAMLNARLKKVANLKYVTMEYVADQVKADPNLDCDPNSPEFSALVKREMPKYVDLVLYLTIRDLGWFHEYKAAYEAYETVTDRVKYYGKTPDGKDFSGWMDVERQVLVYHPPHYDIYDSATANFGLLDPQSWKYVWTYSDVRTRLSYAFGKDYDHSGPESVLNRIFDDAVAKMPIYPKEQSRELVYN